MARSGVTALCLALILALVEFGSCLRCYQCISTRDPSCKDNPGEEFLTDCQNHDAISFNQIFLTAILPKEIRTGIVGSARYCHKIVLESGDVARTCLDGNAIKVDLSCQIIMGGANAIGLIPIPLPSTMRIHSCHVCDKNMCNAAGSVTAFPPLCLLSLLVSYIYTKT